MYRQGDQSKRIVLLEEHLREKSLLLPIDAVERLRSSLRGAGTEGARVAVSPINIFSFGLRIGDCVTYALPLTFNADEIRLIADYEPPQMGFSFATLNFDAYLVRWEKGSVTKVGPFHMNFSPAESAEKSIDAPVLWTAECVVKGAEKSLDGYSLVPSNYYNVVEGGIGVKRTYAFAFVRKHARRPRGQRTEIKEINLKGKREGGSGSV